MWEKIKLKIFGWSDRKVRKHYGDYDATIQFPFYRCQGCRGVITWMHIKTGTGCSKCGGGRVNPTNLSLFEEIRVIFFPWTFRFEKVSDEIPQVTKQEHGPFG